MASLYVCVGELVRSAWQHDTHFSHCVFFPACYSYFLASFFVLGLVINHHRWIFSLVNSFNYVLRKYLLISHDRQCEKLMKEQRPNLGVSLVQGCFY